MMELTKKDTEVINTKAGLRLLFADKKINLEKVLRNANYESDLIKIQEELIKLQQWVIDNKKRVVILFEGRDAAGKGGAIRRITAHINPRHFRVRALPTPTSEEKGQWYFQRYVNELPKPGEMVFFDRSWYNRAVVEPVNGFCTPEEYELFMGQINEFERMICEPDLILIKFYFSITKEEQAKRFVDIRKSPLKKWKMSPVDEKAQELWEDYTKYKEAMFEKTNTALHPWIVIKANRKTEARLEAAQHILNLVPYDK